MVVALKPSARVVPALLFLSLVFAGCSGSGETEDGHDHEDGEHDEHVSDGNETMENATVVAVISVLVDGNVTEPVNGSIPVVAGANITFDGSASEGTNLTYAWEFGDGATGTNATEVHAYTAVGEYEAMLTVASGNASNHAMVTLNVSAAGPPVGSIIWVEEKSFSGSLPLGNPNSAMNAGVDYNDHKFPVAAADPNGTAVLAKKVTVILDGSGATNVQMYVYWRSPGGQNLATGGGSQSPDQSTTYEGDMPAGDYVVRVRLFAGAQATYTVKAKVEYASV